MASSPLNGAARRVARLEHGGLHVVRWARPTLEAWWTEPGGDVLVHTVTGEACPPAVVAERAARRAAVGDLTVIVDVVPDREV